MPLTVSTSCPSCGGGLEFEEGTNAVRCGFCGSSHVVTGHGQVLSYYIPEKIPLQKAVAVALLKLKEAGEGGGTGWKAREATLFFVPFYHFSGQVLRWEVQEIAVSQGDEGLQAVVVRSVYVMDSSELISLIAGEPGTGSARLTEKRFELASGRVDRSMPALDAPGLNVHSLGLRPEVLKLSLFEKKAVSARGNISPVKFAVRDKEEDGFKPVFEEEAVARRVFGRVRSVVYFPFWLVEVARDGETFFAVVDGVSGDAPNLSAPVSLLDALLDRDGDRFEVAGLRPLKCPDCAADLPVRPRDVVFFCGGCRKAWHIRGSEFAEVTYTAVRPKSEKQGEKEYFPFWVVRARVRAGDRVIDNKYGLSRLAPGLTWPKEEDKAVPLRFFVPAFEMGNPKVLSRLASGFTRNQPVWEADTPGDFKVRGSFLSAEDALELAPLIIFSLVPKANRHAVSFALEAVVEPLEAELALVPFYRGRFEYTDGLFGWSVPAAAVKD